MEKEIYEFLEKSETVALQMPNKVREIFLESKEVLGKVTRHPVMDLDQL